MRVGIDISSIVYGTGVSVYTKRLVENLLKLDPDTDYVLFAGTFRRRGEIDSFISGLPKARMEGKVFPFPPTIADFVWNWLHVLPVESLLGDLDLFHTSDWSEPPSGSKKVTTIHDLSPLLYPEFTHPKIVAVHRRKLEWVKKEADAVIVPSETTAGDAERFGINKKIIKVIPESYSYKKASEQAIGDVRERYGIKGKYFLSVGVNKRKNTYRIVKSFMKIKTEINCQLVIVGHKGVSIPGTEGVIFTNYVSDSDIEALYSGAEALVYPSIYEGFGLPILEAFHLGVPVLTSEIGSMAEVAEEAAVLVDPYSVKSIIKGMKSVVEKKSALAAAGKRVVKNYSWTKVVQMTLGVYKNLI